MKSTSRLWEGRDGEQIITSNSLKTIIGGEGRNTTKYEKYKKIIYLWYQNRAMFHRKVSAALNVQ